MKPFSIAGVQMHVSASAHNVDVMLHKIDVLMNVYPWVQMVVFSELCAYGPLTFYAQDYPNDTLHRFCDTAKKYGIWIVPGTMFRKDNGKIYNTASVINPEGEIIGRFDKLFPFYPYEEGVTGGNEFLIWDIPDVGRFGITVCYDMWFPETSRTLAVHGVEVLLHPTLTATIDRDIELAMAQATAASNQLFVFDINGLGDGGTGRSIICGPDGRIIYQASTGPELIPIEVDMNRVHRSREFGVLRLGQPLKSFRDRNVHFDIYESGKKLPFLEKLGGLSKPERISKLKTIYDSAPDSNKEDPRNLI